jgi:hypothetical protein
VVLGTCSATTTRLKMEKNSSTTFNLYLNYDCSLAINQQIITRFNIDLKLVVNGIARVKSIDFKVIAYEVATTFIQ